MLKVEKTSLPHILNSYKKFNSRDQLAQSGERLLTNPAIRGRFSAKPKNTYLGLIIFALRAIKWATSFCNLTQDFNERQCHLLEKQRILHSLG